MSELTIDYLVRACGICDKDISHLYALRKYCVECNEQRNAARDDERKENARITSQMVDYWLLIYNKSRAFSSYGKHDPLTELPHISIERRKDHAAVVPMSKDLACPVDAPKFTQVTPDDVDWATKQKGVSHVLPMPRPLSNYCVCCREAVIDGTKEVRVTKGCYLPVEHDCPRTRVYDLHGKLLEVIR